MDYISRFQDLLGKLFQFDASDLDFGIYRILNYKRLQIRKFIHEDLGRIIDEAFSKYRDERMENIAELSKEAKQKVIQSLGPGVVLPSGDLREEFKETPVGKDYLLVRARMNEAAAIEEIKSQVFNDLYNFFSRYYDEGDFVPQYRYSIKNHKYAIPYNGEEVKLYWANSDQYYTKTGILFRDYAFFTDPARSYKILFRTVSAREELGSNKATKARFFVLDDDKPAEMIDKNILVVRFQYRELTAGEVKKYEVGGGSNPSKQDKINQGIFENILKGTEDPTLKAFLGREYKNEKPLLLYQMSRFAAKNSRDFFIHKNLKKFLSDQLDYFIKAEVISIETLERERFLDRHITRAKVVREIGEKIIDFLSQIEDFQKKLWEKKKFVLRTEYVITADRVPEDFHEKIWKNKGQVNEWKTLGFGAVKSKKGLKDKKLPIDTIYFPEGFKEKLLERLTENGDLDELLDGLLIRSENCQALKLLQERYREKVNCIHIDPPYNTQTSGFLYKNNFQHSSWLAMIAERVNASLSLLYKDGAYQCHIDENEYEVLHQLFENSGIPNAGTIVWDKKNPMLGRKGVATQHEYVIWRTSCDRPIYRKNKNILMIVAKAKAVIRQYGGVSEKSRKEFAKWINTCKGLSGGERAYRFIDDEGRIFQSVAMGAPEPRTDPKFFIPLIHPITKKECSVPSNGWSRAPETLQRLVEKGEILFGKDETVQPRLKVYLTEESQQQISSVIQNAQRGKADVVGLGLEFPYCHPVSLYEELLGAGLPEINNVALDFFAGSGTTAHAVMSLNKEDGGTRKFILVEMANYFETVIIPRIKKVAYSFNWRDGKPQDSDGIGVFFKYQVLEQYEDTLDNLDLRENKDAQHLFGNDYLLKYFLDFESRDDAAFVNFEEFKQPFLYKLKVNFDEVGEPEEVVVDLPETFHYLLGLKAKKIKARNNKGRKYLFTLGEKEGRAIAVVWREYDDGWTEKDFKRDKDFILSEIESWAPRIVYVNGQTALTPKIGKQTAEIRAIEPEFRKRMVEGG